MQRIEAGQPFRVIVDYAHTPDSLAKVLDNLAPLAAAGGGGLVCVFGSAGDRDRAEAADDGPRGRRALPRGRGHRRGSRAPRTAHAILDEIAAGAESLGRRRGQDLLVIPDRREAIGRAIGAGAPGDVVLLAGKGHEKTIEMADGDVPWDEGGEALAGIGLRGPGQGQIS